MISKAHRYVVKIDFPRRKVSVWWPAVSPPATLCAPVTQFAVAESASTPASEIAPRTSASGRWPRSGSDEMSSSRSTPRNMMTKRNSTTIAPA